MAAEETESDPTIMEALGHINVEQKRQSAHLDAMHSMMMWVVLLLALPYAVAVIYYIVTSD